MAYYINQGTAYTLASKVVYLSEWQESHSDRPVQELPAECNAGEIFVVTLCRDCLLQLAAELKG